MKRIIIHVFHVGNNLESVKKALTTLEGLQSWWTNDVTGSPAVGGIIKFRFADVFKPDMKVIQSNDSIVQWECVAGEKEWAGDLFTFSFTDKGKTVSVKFTQEYVNEITDEQYGTFNFNWGYYLHSLKQYCETDKGTPWYNKPQLKDQVIFYFGPESVFSHWYKCRFVINEIAFCCVEQYLMYSKALLFNDTEIANKMLRSSDPKRHRYLGRKVKAFNKPVWRSKCREFAFEANLAKFSEDVELKNALIKTAGMGLAEASPYDRNWGIGLSISNPKIYDLQNWRGNNWCGEVLESVRKTIIESMSKS